MAAGWQRQDFTSPTGAVLALYETPPAAPVKGIVHINHGLAEHAARYAPFAEYLAGRGYHVAAQDHRGHGYTTAKDGGARLFAKRNGWKKVTEDTASVNAHLRAQHPGKPVFVLGHSMGGTVAMNHVMRHPDTVAGAAIWNANLSAPFGLMQLVLGLDSLIASKLMGPELLLVLIGRPLSNDQTQPGWLIDKLTFRDWDKCFLDERPQFGWLSRDLAVVDAYAADPLCGWPATISLWKEFVRGMKFAANDQNLAPVRKNLPFHLVGGSSDPATEGGKATLKMAERLRKAGFTDVSAKVLDGFRHETLNEIGAEAEMAKFADWLDARVG